MLKNVLEAIKWKNNYKKWNVKNEKNLKKTEFIKRKWYNNDKCGKYD